VPDKPPPSAPAYVRRDRQINVRIDAELYEAAMAKAYAYGLGAVIRALVRAYVRGDTKLREEDLRLELTTAPRERRPRKRKPAQ
jgi:hypothetical protein